MKKKILLLYSGGMDSTVLLELAMNLGYDVSCLIFHYGQVHEEEVQYAKNYCGQQAVNYTELSIPLPIPSMLTTGDKQYEGVSPWHVPARNMIFLSYAAALAESQGIDLIWFGANYEDRENIFPDCFQEWVYQANKLLQINGSKSIKLEAPLLGMQKETIKRLATELNISNDKIFSGYGR